MKKKYQSTVKTIRGKVSPPFPLAETRKQAAVRPRPYHRRARRGQ